MKTFLIKLFLNLFGRFNVKTYLESELDTETRTRYAMDYLIAEGMKHRVLPTNFVKFAQQIFTGVKSAEAYYNHARHFVIQETPRPSEAAYIAVLGLLKPFCVDAERVAADFHKVRVVVGKEEKNFMRYSSVMSKALIEAFPNIPVDTAKAIASVTFHVLNK